MNPRPFYRWKSFWLGVLVLMFCIWAWVRSYGFNEAVGHSPTPYEGRLLGQVAGTVFYYYTKAPWAHSTGFGMTSEPAEPWLVNDNGWFPAPWVHRWHDGHMESNGFHIAHWLLILLFFIPWMGLLIWRIRKQRKPNS
jgi:hypothetical protein